MPVHALAKIPAHERRDERAGVDPHVEDRIARVSARIVRGIQPADDDADVALQEAGANDDEEESEVEGGERWHGHAEVAAGDQDAAVQHRALRTDQAVRDPAARQRRHVHHRRVQAVDGARGGRVEAQAAGGGGGGHEQDQKGAHPVVAEALPHLREEEGGEASRMTEEGGVARVRYLRNCVSARRRCIRHEARIALFHRMGGCGHCSSRPTISDVSRSASPRPPRGCGRRASRSRARMRRAGRSRTSSSPRHPSSPSTCRCIPRPGWRCRSSTARGR